MHWVSSLILKFFLLWVYFDIIRKKASALNVLQQFGRIQLSNASIETKSVKRVYIYKKGANFAIEIRSVWESFPLGALWKKNLHNAHSDLLGLISINQKNCLAQCIRFPDFEKRCTPIGGCMAQLPCSSPFFQPIISFMLIFQFWNSKRMSNWVFFSDCAHSSEFVFYSTPFLP